MLASLFLILFGARAVLIAYAGSPTPFLDEWRADAPLLRAYLEGNLTARDLLTPLNEHRILFTKLLVLSILRVSGYWDVVLQMIANAILNAAFVVAFAWTLARVLDRGLAIAAMILSTAINALPLGFDNAVLGFNTHFYLLMAFSMAGLWFLAGSRAGSPGWAAGTLCGIGAYLCMASGAVTLAAAAAAQGAQMACGRRTGMREGFGVAALLLLTAVMIALVPHVPEAEELKAHSLGAFLSAFVKLASWPAFVGLGPVLLLPSALFCLRVLSDRPALSDPRWFNVMALGWVVAQLLVLAVGRAQFPLQSRYFDFLLVGVTVNLVSALWLFQNYATAARRTFWGWLALAGWLSLLGLSLIHPQRQVFDKIEEWRRITETGGRNVQGYVATGEASFLAGKPAVDIPAFDTDSLRKLLDDPHIRSVLPPELRSRPLPQTWTEAFKTAILRFGWVWLGLGVLLLALNLAREYRTSSAPRDRRSRRKDFA